MMTSHINTGTEIWVSLWTVTLLISLAVPCYRCAFMSHGQCAGQSLTISCGSSHFMLHVLYELYTYNPTDIFTKCDTEKHQCSNAEFLNPISVGHCNGNSGCTFQVPSNKYIPSCDKNNTAMKVLYTCIPRPQVFDICSNFIHTHLQKLYLVTPQFPSNDFKQNRCFCSVTGQNLKGTVLQHEKQVSSRVIMILSTDKGTMHINGVNVLNTGLFDGVQKLNLNIYNDQPSELFKLWLQISGKDMILKCGTGPPAWSSGSSQPIKATPALSSSLYLTSSDQTKLTFNTELAGQSSSSLVVDEDQKNDTDITPSKSSSYLQTTSSQKATDSSSSSSVHSSYSAVNKLSSSTSSSVHSSSDVNIISSSSTCEMGTNKQSNSMCVDTITSSNIVDQMTTSSTTEFQSTLSTSKDSLNNYIPSSLITQVLVTNSEITVGTPSASMTVKLEPSGTESSHIAGETTPSYFIPSSSVTPQDQNNLNDSTKTGEKNSDLTLIIILSSLACLLFLCLLAAIIFFGLRWIKNKHHRMHNEDIYDAFEDNPAVEPDPEPVVVNGPRPLMAAQPNRNVLPIFLLNVMWYMLQ